MKKNKKSPRRKPQDEIYILHQKLKNDLSYKGWAVLAQALNIAQKSFNEKKGGEGEEKLLQRFCLPEYKLRDLCEAKDKYSTTKLLEENLKYLRNYFSHSYHKIDNVSKFFKDSEIFDLVQNLQQKARNEYEKKIDQQNDYKMDDIKTYFDYFVFTKMNILAMKETDPFKALHLHFILHFIAPLLSHQQIGIAVSRLFFHLKDEKKHPDHPKKENKNEPDPSIKKLIKYYQCLTHRGIYYAVSDEEQKQYYEAYDLIAHLARLRVFGYKDQEKEISPHERDRRYDHRFVWGSRYVISFLVDIYKKYDAQLTFEAIKRKTDLKYKDPESQTRFTDTLFSDDQYKEDWFIRNRSLIHFKCKVRKKDEEEKEYALGLSQLYFWALTSFYLEKKDDEKNKEKDEKNQKRKAALAILYKMINTKNTSHTQHPIRFEKEPADFLRRRIGETGKQKECQERPKEAMGKDDHDFWPQINQEKSRPHDHMLYVMKNINYFIKFYHFEQSSENDVQEDHKKIGLSKDEYHYLQNLLNQSTSSDDFLSSLKENSQFSESLMPKISFLQNKNLLKKLGSRSLPYLWVGHLWEDQSLNWETLASRIHNNFWKKIQENFLRYSKKHPQGLKNMALLMGWKGQPQDQNLKETSSRSLPKYAFSCYFKKQITDNEEKLLFINKEEPFQKSLLIHMVDEVAGQYICLGENEHVFNPKNDEPPKKGYNQIHRCLNFYMEDVTLFLIAFWNLKVKDKESEAQKKYKKDEVFNEFLYTDSTVDISIKDKDDNQKEIALYEISLRSPKRQINGLSQKAFIQITYQIKKDKKSENLKLTYDDFHQKISQLSSESIYKIACLLTLEKEAYDDAQNKQSFYKADGTPSFSGAAYHIFSKTQDKESQSAITDFRNSLLHFDLTKGNLDEIPPQATKWQKLYKKVLVQEKERKDNTIQNNLASKLNI